MAEQSPKMDWSHRNLADAFRIFIQRLELYFVVKSITQEAAQVPILLLATGEEGLRRFNSWNLSEADMKNKCVIITRFREQLDPGSNYRVQRLTLSTYKIQPGESIDQFITRAKELALQCQFSETELNDRLIELIIASTQISEYQKDLLSKPKEYTLDEALKLGRVYEASALNLQTLKTFNYEGAHSRIDSIKSSSKSSTCRNCGRSHQPRQCPAYGAECTACHKTGHWAKFCLTTKFKNRYRSKSRNRNNQNRSDDKRASVPWKHQTGQHHNRNHKNVNAIDSSEVNDMNCQFESFSFAPIIATTGGARDQAFTSLGIKIDKFPGAHELKIKVDTGAQRNTLPVRLYKQMFNQSLVNMTKHACLTKLYAYNGTEIKHYGTVDIPCKFNDSEWTDTKFYVVEVNGSAILGLPSCEQLGLVTMHCAVTAEPKTTYLNSVDDLIKTELRILLRTISFISPGFILRKF
ncbi:Uncharacterised protein r2_g3242 [Pycnogonum litorale]